MNPEVVTNIIISGCDNSERFIRETMARAPGALRWMIDHNIATFLAPDFVKEQLVAMYLAVMRRAADLFLEAIDLFRSMVRGLGRPTELRQAADALNANAAAATSLSDDMTPQALLGLSSQDHWKSRATVPYGAGLTEQVESTAGIGEVMRALENTLRNMADSIESFYGNLVVAEAGLVAAVVGLALCFTGPPAIVGIVVAALGVIVAIVSLIVVFTSTSSTNTTNAATLVASPRINWTKSQFAG